MKRKSVLAILLSIAMVFGVVGCGTSQSSDNKDANTSQSSDDKGTDTSEGDTAGSENPVNDSVKEGGGYKIGFWYTPDSDLLSKEFRETLDYCAKLTNCEMEYYDIVDWSVEQQTAAVESLVSNGCDGIIMMYGSSPSIFQYMNDNEVYYSAYTRSHTDEVALIADGSEYCTGWLNEGSEAGNTAYGYAMAEALAEAGCKNIAYNSGAAGVEVHDDRVAGIEQAAADLGMNIVTNYRGSETATGFSDILASYGSEIDGIAYTMGSDVGVAAIQAAGLSGKVKLAQLDNAGESTQEYMDAELLTATCSANNVHIIQMYMQIYNALSGADRLFDEGEKLIPMIPAVVVKSAEEWEQAEKYTMGEVPGLVPDEIFALNSIYTPDTTIEEKEALMTSYTTDEFWNIESISERVGGFLGE